MNWGILIILAVFVEVLHCDEQIYCSNRAYLLNKITIWSLYRER